MKTTQINVKSLACREAINSLQETKYLYAGMLPGLFGYLFHRRAIFREQGLTEEMIEGSKQAITALYPTNKLEENFAKWFLEMDLSFFIYGPEFKTKENWRGYYSESEIEKQNKDIAFTQKYRVRFSEKAKERYLELTGKKL